MTAKPTKTASDVRFDGLVDLPAAPPLSSATKGLDDAEVERRAASDPDAGAIPADFWDGVDVVEPEGTVQITLRLPKRVVGHFKATGKGYQSRISAVLSSYVDAARKRGSR